MLKIGKPDHEAFQRDVRGEPDEKTCNKNGVKSCIPSFLVLASEAAGKGYCDVAIAAAFRSGDFTMKQLAEHFGVHYSTVSRAVKKGEGGR